MPIFCGRNPTLRALPTLAAELYAKIAGTRTVRGRHLDGQKADAKRRRGNIAQCGVKKIRGNAEVAAPRDALFFGHNRARTAQCGNAFAKRLEVNFAVFLF